MVDKKLSDFDLVSVPDTSYFPIIGDGIVNKRVTATDVYARTNCFTSITKNINLTLDVSTGTLTLASGSKVYVPNGSNTFNALTISANKTYKNTGNAQLFVCVDASTSNLTTLYMTGSSVSARPSSPINFALYYNYTANKCEYYNGTSWVQVSLPIAVVSRNTSGYTSIDQLFDGFGFVGNALFILPATEGLYCNGRNSNQTAKVGKVTINTVKLRDFTQDYPTTLNGTYWAWLVAPNFSVSIQRSNLVSWHNDTNTLHNSGTEEKGLVFARFTSNGTRITNAIFPNVYTGTDAFTSTVLAADLYTNLGDLEQQIDEVRHAKVRELFEPIWSDHIINDPSWVRTDTFSWLSGNTYSNAYNHITADISGKSANIETIAGTQITYYRATDGHKIVLASQETNIENIYTSTGIAWYYILDTANQRFKLPRTKWEFIGLRDTIGNYVAPGLPNITGTSQFNQNNANRDLTGCFYNPGISSNNHTHNQNNAKAECSLGFDASRSSSIYGASNTVQPPATQMYLYMYIGQFTQTALEQTAGINTSLFNGKADIDLGNAVNNASAIAKSTIVSWMMPNFSRAITRSTGSESSPNTTNTDCLVVFRGTSITNNGGGAGLIAYINSEWIAVGSGSGNGLNSLNISGNCYLPKGTKYYIKTPRLEYCYEYPLKGV